MSYYITLLYQIGEILIKIIFLLISIAYFTIAERKAMAAIQRRKGPNVVGPFGLLQPLADGLKLVVKQLLMPTKANKLIFLFAPVAILTLSLISWSVIPFSLVNNEESVKLIPVLLQEYIEFNEKFFLDLEYFNILGVSKFYYSLFFLLALSSLNVYSIIIAGWSSNSKYAFLGCLRSAAQMISYEVSIGLVLLPVVLLSKSLNLTEIVLSQEKTGWYFYPLLPCALIFFISMLAETNRTPFDLPEAEAELVAGYNVEYGSLIFAMFFLGEYSNMLLMSTLISLLFFGGWTSSFFFFPLELVLAFKLTIFCFAYIVVRATLPRYKYNQLMDIGWKIFLPIMLAFFFLIVFINFLNESFIILSYK